MFNSHSQNYIQGRRKFYEALIVFISLFPSFHFRPKLFLLKSTSISAMFKEDEIVIAADTTVIIDNSILGKPSDVHEAKEMLSSLSGRSHHVTTGVCIKDKHQMDSFTDTTWVQFRTLTDKEIDYYIKNFEPFDKAGGYGIQEWIGMIGIDRIEGSYFTVMGLPIHKLYTYLLRH